MDLDHEVFDLLVERSGPGYRARVVSSPAGNETSDLEELISEDQLQSFLFKVGRPRRAVRRAGPSISEDTKKFGQQLFRFLFPGKILACLERSKYAAGTRGRGLRIQIRLSDVPELCDLPWEFLYHEEAGFLALSTQTPIARFLELRQPTPPLEVDHALRVLVVIASPRDLPRLDVDREWEKLRDALTDVEEKGLLHVERLDVPRLSRLNRRLRTEQFHILHFVGHGDFDDGHGVGELFFEDEQGRSAPVSAEQLATALRDHRSIRLVVLNACEGARSSRTDPFAGTAQALIRTGIPAVIAMQFEVTDDAAITFAGEFYTSIAVGYSVDRSLSEARKAIYLDGNELEWATPVLYLRSLDSRIFVVPQTNEVEQQRTKLAATRKSDFDETAASLAQKKALNEEAFRPEEKPDAPHFEQAAPEVELAAPEAMEQRQADEADQLAEEKRKAEEDRQAEVRRAAELSAQEAEKQLKAERDAQIAEEKRKAEEDRLEEARREAERAAHQQAAEQRKAERDAQIAGEKREAEEDRQVEARREAELAAKQLAEQLKAAQAAQLEEKKRKAEEDRLEEARREAERAAHQQAAEQRKAERAAQLAEEKRKAEEDRQAAARREAELAAQETEEQRRSDSSTSQQGSEAKPVGQIEQRTVARVSWRLLPLLMLCLFVAVMDRVNIGFAALSMNQELGLSAAAYGLGASIFTLSYALFQVPSVMALERFGFRRWILVVMISWGLLSGAMAMATGEASFYILRFFLGAAEAGFLPGIIFFLTLWFPRLYFARSLAWFMAAQPLMGMLSGQISLAILGVTGWRQMFMLEAIPAVILSIVAWFLLADRPFEANWLTAEQRNSLCRRLDAEAQRRKSAYAMTVAATLASRRVLALVLVGFILLLVTNGVWFSQFQMSRALGLSPNVWSFVIGAGVVVSMVGLARRSDAKMERKSHASITLALAAGAFAASALISDPTLRMLAFALGACASYAVLPVFWTLPTAFLSDAPAAASIALINATGSLAALIVPFVLGALRSATGSWMSGLWVIAVCAGVAALMLRASPYDRKLEEIPQIT